MPRKTQKKATSNSLPQENALSFSSIHARINFLNEQHKKLLTKIKRKKTELSNLTQQMQTLTQEMVQKSRPFYEKINSLDQKIHGLFEKILSNKRLGKRQKQEVLEIYQVLQLTGKISPRPEYFSQPSSANVQDEDEDRDDYEQTKEKDFFGENHHYDENEDISQPRPSRDLRKIFLKLADKFHPDKASDNETRIFYTEIMKEINIAYQSGDLARLLEIERDKNQENVKFSQNDSEKECEQLEKEIELLSQQYEQVKLELREVKKTPQGNMVKQYRKAKRQGENLMEMLIAEAEVDLHSLQALHDFVKDFKDRKITLKEFVRGPNYVNIDDMEDMINEMFVVVNI
ncbi:MAG: J domain-containing protein [Okeania sp. SIO3B5]|uniref:J domain-containing protein n=1 Tax=Okeania sp. SIO3B5 TaxID=2607811 RepID=UPI001400332F|nr:J domain-containing protein [Okeania sp. SIO3B5]NEO52439.1 J domain-containing protein [Okeania sp. SIO3B5]